MDHPEPYSGMFSSLHTSAVQAGVSWFFLFFTIPSIIQSSKHRRLLKIRQRVSIKQPNNE